MVKNPNRLDSLKSEDFINYIGDILVRIVDEQLKNGTVK